MATVNELIQIAVGHHQNGQLQKAETVYRRILQDNPHHTDVLHLLGLLAHQRGNNVIAVELINKAIASNPDVPLFHSNLGLALNALGK